MGRPWTDEQRDKFRKTMATKARKKKARKRQARKGTGPHPEHTPLIDVTSLDSSKSRTDEESFALYVVAAWKAYRK